jgi:hypothetical protein
LRLFLEAVDAPSDFPDAFSVQLIALNDSFDPVTLDHRLLIGPNVESAAPMPVSVEPSLPEEAANMTTLGPWCLYGRQRPFHNLSGKVTFHAYLVRAADGVLLPQGPADADSLVTTADPLTIDIR